MTMPDSIQPLGVRLDARLRFRRRIDERRIDRQLPRRELLRRDHQPVRRLIRFCLAGNN